MHKISLYGAMLLSISLLLPAAQSASANGAGSAYNSAPRMSTSSTAAAPADQSTILGWLQDQGDYTKFVQGVQAANYTDRLTGGATYTVFAPTDEAFNKLPSGVWDSLLQPENRDLLQQVLDYHITPGTVSTAQLTSLASVPTLEGDAIPVTNNNGTTLLGGANIIEQDKPAGNGVVDAIDTVLLPPTAVQRLASAGFDLTAYASGSGPTGVVMGSTQRKQTTSSDKGPNASYPAPAYGNNDVASAAGNGTYMNHGPTVGNGATPDTGTMDEGGFANNNANQPPPGDTTAFGDSGTYGNSNNYGDSGNFYNSELEGGPVIADGTLYTPSLREARMAAGDYSYDGAVMDYSASKPMMGMGHGNDLGQCSARAALEASMRKLWTDHVVWTRDYIIAALNDQPDAQAASDRLMQNQEEIGQAISVYYGADAGNQLTALLKEHIAIAAKVVDAAKRQDTAEFNTQNKAWQANGQAIAAFLSKANPDNWPLATMSQMMQTHLDTTTSEVQARLSKDYTADVAAYDRVYQHILMMSDALADGIYKQFPEQVAAVYPPSTANGVVMDYAQRKPGYAGGDTYYDSRDNDNGWNSGSCSCGR